MFTIGYLRHKEDLQLLATIGTGSNKEMTTPESLLMKWWLAYPKGLKAVFNNDTLVGALGLWPVSSSWIKDLLSGTCQEPELLVQDLTYFTKKPATNWYISGILMTARFRRTKAINELIAKSIDLWLRSEQQTFPVNLYVLASSNHGQGLLTRFNFTCVQNSDKTALYHRRYNTLLQAGAATSKKIVTNNPA